MKSRTLFVLLLIALFGGAGCKFQHRTNTQAKPGEAVIAPSDAGGDAKASAALDATDGQDHDLAEKEEIRRSYTLKPGASVEIRGINGPVKVETADTTTADVLIIRSAKTREDLQYRQINIDHDANSLTIRTESDRKSIFSSIGNVPQGRQRVIVRLPRKIDFEVNGVNGSLNVAGELQGRFEVRGVTGEVKAARIAGETDLTGINGEVDVTFAPLTGKGIELRGINGNIELRFEGEVNADVQGFGVNGKVDPEFPNVEQGEASPGRSRVRTRIGSGGTRIELSGINGNIHLSPAGKGKAEKAKLASK